MLESYLKQLRQMSQKHQLFRQLRNMLLGFHLQLILVYGLPYVVLANPDLGNLLAKWQRLPFRFYFVLQTVQPMMLRLQLLLRPLETYDVPFYSSFKDITLFEKCAILSESVVYIYKPIETNPATVN